MNTVNVIEMVDGNIIGLISFSDNKKENIEAEKLFAKIALENDCKKRDIESYIEDGYYENGDYQLFLTHSN